MLPLFTNPVKEPNISRHISLQGPEIRHNKPSVFTKQVPCVSKFQERFQLKTKSFSFNKQMKSSLKNIKIISYCITLMP